MTTSFPRFHRLAWQPEIVGTVAYDDGSTSGTLDLSADIARDYWGFAPEGADPVTAGAESIQHRLVSIIAAALGSGVVTPQYRWPNGDHGVPLTRYFGVQSDPVALTFSSVAAAQQFGFTSTEVTLPTTGAYVDADVQDAGHWGPRVRTGRDESTQFNPNVGTAESIDGSQPPKMRVWGADRTRRVMRWTPVCVADVRADAASVASLAAMSGRSASDPNSLLEQLCAAARSPIGTEAPPLRVYTEPEEFRVAYMLAEGLRDVDAMLTDASGRRWWTVSLTLRGANG